MNNNLLSSAFKSGLAAASGSASRHTKGAKFDVDAFMCLDHLAAALKDDGLRGVKCCEICGAARVVVKTCGKHDLAAFKMVIGVL